MNEISLEQKLRSALVHVEEELEKVQNFAQLEEIRLQYLSNKGVLAQLTHEFKELIPEKKREMGSLLQDVKRKCTASYEAKKVYLEEKASALPEYAFFDPSLSSYKPLPKGSLHPYTEMLEKLEDIFTSLGFEVVEGPVVEEEYYNFSALNIPHDHPARDSHDTFWLANPGRLLRTHTSSVEIREAQRRNPPFAIVSHGRVYRNEATDASHDFMFWQCEGLYIAEDASIANLLFVLKRFLQMLFEKEDLDIRTRPSYFPFVEPGLEVDMSCPFCKGGCSTCKKTGWIEICGAGMTHPNVLKAMQIEYPKYSAFAFGFGITRLVMLQYQIRDIRTLHKVLPFLS